MDLIRRIQIGRLGSNAARGRGGPVPLALTKELNAIWIAGCSSDGAGPAQAGSGGERTAVKRGAAAHGEEVMS
jgi:hypothetical protein